MTPEQHADAILRASGLMYHKDAHVSAILAAVTAAMEDGKVNADAHALAYDVVCEQRDALRAQLTKVEAERDRLREALQKLLSATEQIGFVHYGPHRAKARAALKETDYA